MQTGYYLDQARERGTTDTFEAYLDPVGYEVFLSRTDSFWLGTTEDVRMTFVDLSVLQLLVQDSQLGRVTGDHEYEVFVSGSSSLKSELEDGIREVVDELDS
jgi:hypothetical protein